MKRVWETDELLEHWGLSPEEREMALTDKTDAVAIGFALLLKWFQYEGRFPAYRIEVPAEQYRPVIQALELLKKYADSEQVYYDADETVPLDDIVPDEWRDQVVTSSKRKKARVAAVLPRSSL